MEKKTNNPAITKSYAKKMETISPFELKNKLINMADESIKKIALFQQVSTGSFLVFFQESLETGSNSRLLRNTCYSFFQ